MSLFYDFLFIIFVVLYFPYVVIKGKWHARFMERFGSFSKEDMRSISGLRSPIWLHAVSVGEVAAVVPLAKRLKQEYPDKDLLVTTVTVTGQKLAETKMPEGTMLLFAPLDASWIVRKFIGTVRPALYIAAETEIWPNLYLALHQWGIPIVQINGRISDRAFKRYKTVKFLLKSVLDHVTILGAQSELDRQRFIELGADEKKLCVTGNVKFDVLLENAALRPDFLGYGPQDKVIVAGSTHPGEEEIILHAYGVLRRTMKDVRLIMAPRHIERAAEVADLVRKYGWEPLLFSRRPQDVKDNEVMIIDEIGWLMQCYVVATVVFIGKTFRVGGGQNMIEPAACGQATIVGPRAENFKDVMRVLLEADGIVQVADEESLLQALEKLLADGPYRSRIGNAAKQCVLKYGGATEKTMQLIRGLRRVT